MSVPCVRSDGLYIQPAVTSSACTVMPGCPIRKSQDQCSFDSSPGLIAVYHVLHRLITPRHPPCTLSSLITFITGPNGTRGGTEGTNESCQAAETLDSFARGLNSRKNFGELLFVCYPYSVLKEPSQLWSLADQLRFTFASLSDAKVRHSSVSPALRKNKIARTEVFF